MLTELERDLAEITGLPGFPLSPTAAPKVNLPG